MSPSNCLIYSRKITISILLKLSHKSAIIWRISKRIVNTINLKANLPSIGY